jgi:hypothetical protein
MCEWIVLPLLIWHGNPDVTLSDGKIEMSHSNTGGGANNIVLLEENSTI